MKEKLTTTHPILYIDLYNKHHVSQQAFHRTDLFKNGKVGESPINVNVFFKKILKHGWAFEGVLWGFFWIPSNL